MGDEDDTKPGAPCPACEGRGWIVLFIRRSKCPDCRGSGISPGKHDPADETLEFDDDSRTPPRGTKVP